jgi:hypothetical protein
MTSTLLLRLHHEQAGVLKPMLVRDLPTTATSKQQQQQEQQRRRQPVLCMFEQQDSNAGAVRLQAQACVISPAA